jgi:hypothetical protein
MDKEKAKPAKKKLAIKKETIQELTEQDLDRVAGGIGSVNCYDGHPARCREGYRRLQHDGRWCGHGWVYALGRHQRHAPLRTGVRSAMSAPKTAPHRYRVRTRQVAVLGRHGFGRMAHNFHKVVSGRFMALGWGEKPRRCVRAPACGQVACHRLCRQ